MARVKVVSRRHIVGVGVSVVVHAAALVIAGTIDRAPVLENEMEIVEVEIVEIESLLEKSVVERVGDEAEEDDEPAPAPVTTRVRKKTPQPEPVAPALEETPAIEPPPVEPTPGEVAIAPPSPAARGGTGPSKGSGRGKPGRLDHSTYGAEIVRIVLAEIDRDPVPGIARTDTIQVLLKVRPNGDLAWTRDGRWGFAEVLRSSLGRVRTRSVLRRIERASSRFPAHPAGLDRRLYVVDVTVNFSKHS